MRLHRSLTVLAVCAIVPTLAVSAVCGNESDKPSTVGHFATLRSRPNAPFVYYRLDDYVVLADPSVVVQRVNGWTGLSPQADGSRLRAKLLSAIPLRANLDLYEYVLEDPQLWFVARSLIVDLIEAEAVAVVDTGGIPLQRLYVEHYRSQELTATLVRFDKRAHSVELMRRVECIAN